MSISIQFLESLGRNPALIPGGLQAYVEEVESLEVSEAERMALRDRDHAALNGLLDGRSAIYCMISTPDEAPLKDPDDHGDGQDSGRETEDTPDKDG